MLKYFGRMNDPVASAFIQGICGDEMEFYLNIEDNVITDIKYYTTGCEFTKICAATTASLVIDKTITQVLEISPQKIKKNIINLPKEHLHCTILCTMTLFKAIAQYLFNQNV